MDLSKWVNKRIGIDFINNQSFTGKLISYSTDSIVIQNDHGINGIVPYSAIMMIVEMKEDENAPQDQ